MTTPETRTLPSGLTVNVLRPSIDIAPLSNKQVEAYLTGQPSSDATAEVWMNRSWDLLATSVNNANTISGRPATTTIEDLKAKFGTGDMTELNKVIFDISGLVMKDVSAAGEASAAQSTGESTSVTSAAA